MATLLQRTFKVTFEVTITVRQIDEDLIARLKTFFRNETLTSDPEHQAWIEREQHLLAAVLADPALLHALLRRAVESLDPLLPTPDGSLQQLTDQQLSDADLFERVRPALSAEDAAFFRQVLEAGVFYDNSMYFQDAWQTEHTSFTIDASPAKPDE